MLDRLACLFVGSMAFVSLSLPGKSAAADVPARSRYSLDMMERTEAIDKTLIDAKGRRMVFEKYPVYGGAAQFGVERAKLFVLDIGRQEPARPLFRQVDSDGYRLGSFSPDGRWLSYLHASASNIVAGVFDFERGQAREIDFPVDLSRAGRWLPLTWISAREFIAPVTTPELFAQRAFTEVADAWQTHAGSTRHSATVFGSGRYQKAGATADAQGLAIVNVETGTVRRIRGDEFLRAMPSSTGKRIAGMRARTTRMPRVDFPIENLESTMSKQVLIYDLAAQAEADPKAIETCNSCDVLGSVFSWSPTGERFVFFAREPDQTWDKGRFWVYDHATGTAQPADVRGLTPVSFALESFGGRPPGAFPAPRFTWLGENLVVKAHAGTSDDAVGWFMLRKNLAPLNLTARFGNSRTEIVGISSDALLVQADGEIWSVDGEGARTLLTRRIGPKVKTVQPEHPKGLPWDPPPRVDSLLLQAEGGTFHFMNVASGETAAMGAPPGDVAASSPASRVLGLKQTRSNVTTLVAMDFERNRHAAMSVNEHLADIAGPVSIRVGHKGPDGEPLTSWLLLPAGYSRENGPLPTIAKVYAGGVYGSAPMTLRPTASSSHTAWMLTSHGYAVLMTSIPVANSSPRDPMDGIARKILGAVDAAIATGYCDPDRLGIEGFSFGGFTTVAAIAQTDRFRVAVAHAGLYDLTSYYGTFGLEDRLHAAHSGGLTMGHVLWAETPHGQGGLAQPPWRDIDRYVRNSPLMKVEDIRTPLMVVHGDMDSVPSTQAEELFTALYRTGKDAVYVRYAGEGHGLASPANIRDYWQRVLAWYDEHVGPPFRD